MKLRRALLDAPALERRRSSSRLALFAAGDLLRSVSEGCRRGSSSEAGYSAVKRVYAGGRALSERPRGKRPAKQACVSMGTGEATDL